MLTNASLHLFSPRGGSSVRKGRSISLTVRSRLSVSTDSLRGAAEGHAVGSCGNPELPLSSDLKRSISLSDIFEVVASPPSSSGAGTGVVVGTVINGVVSRLNLRCSSQEAAQRLAGELQRVLREFTLALEHMKHGWLVAADRHQPVC